ncbi:MAG: hypothetical protein KDK90_20765 [Leptospiraceae bacterium]|nr:hypothetical protein [Leptospiraceae bacterium]
MNLEELKDYLKKLFKLEIAKEDRDLIEFLFLEKVPIVFHKKDFEITLQKLKKYKADSETEIYNQNNYEVLLGFDSNKPIHFFMSNKLEEINIIKDDTLNGISYIISKPSNQFLLFFLNNLKKNNNGSNFKIILNNSPRIKFLFEKGKSISLFYLLKEVLPRFYTLKIISVSPRKQSDFANFSFSMLFNFSYNTNFSILPIRSIEEYTKKLNNHKTKTSIFEDIDAPRRIYINELVHYYMQALANENIEYQFISYYHIIEYFFDTIYYEDITNSVRNTLTLPSFSYKRVKDIRDLIQKIQKKIILKNEDFLLREQELLALTLKKFIPQILEIKKKLQEMDENCIEYYKNNEVPFSKGDKVDLESIDLEEVYKNLSARLYKNKNAISIKRDFIKNRYSPINDQLYLAKEIPLIKTIAEKVILESSKEI